MTDFDRRVHGRARGGWEIVRYDRAGKWCAELPDERVHLSFDEAVDLATKPDSTIYLGVPGGRRFDAQIRRVLEDRADLHEQDRRAANLG